MRPRPEGRGELRRRRSSTPRVGFNAATARRPWRTRRSTRADGPELQCGHGPKAVENRWRTATSADEAVSFNAATARRPWRTDEARRSMVGARKASMRPRPEGRGEPVHCRDSAKRTLQCGHGPKAVENRAGRRRAEWRFNAATARRPWRTAGTMRPTSLSYAASMRPRPEGRGEPATGEAVRAGRAALQCGHGPKAVENRPDSGREATARSRLQCGHGPKAVENDGLSGDVRSDANRFNAATARRPWRTEYAASDAEAVENEMRVANDDCFNAATARRPWRTVRGQGRRTAGLPASMRPRPEGRGEP